MNPIVSLKNIILIGVFVSLTTILSQISIPIPSSPIPLTLQIFAVCLSAVILGSKLGAISQIIYVLLGTIGVPVFAEFSGGPHVILGPSGGYIISFPLIAFIIGRFSENRLSVIRVFFSLFVGLFVCYFLGVIQLSFVTKMSIEKSILIGIAPYFPFDIIKILLATFIVLPIKKFFSNII